MCSLGTAVGTFCEFLNALKMYAKSLGSSSRNKIPFLSKSCLHFPSTMLDNLEFEYLHKVSLVVTKTSPPTFNKNSSQGLSSSLSFSEASLIFSLTPSLSSPEFIPRSVSKVESSALPTEDGPNPKPSDKVPDDDGPILVPLPGSAPWRAPTNWAEAAEFVPKVEKPRSWAQVVNTGVTYPGCEMSTGDAESALCPFYRVGECRYGEGCAYIHGETCDYCGQACLHPTHLDQRRSHLAECLQEHERNMELSFAVARSKEKTCGICMETVLEKPKGEARFGILPSCNHCFCLPCIRKWRQAKQFEHKIIRACPECRQKSDYICPSRFWCETKEEKERLLTDYKAALNVKECKYFNKGEGECPFGNKCFYRHAGRDGREVDVGPPKKPVRRANAEGNLTLVQRLLLYDFLLVE